MMVRDRVLRGKQGLQRQIVAIGHAVGPGHGGCVYHARPAQQIAVSRVKRSAPFGESIGSGTCIASLSHRLTILFARSLWRAARGLRRGGGGPGPRQPFRRLHPAPRPSPRTPRLVMPPPPPIRTATRSLLLVGGADAPLLDHRRRRSLHRLPPDFEAPTDAAATSLFVQLAVSDGATSATLDLAITVTNVGPDAFRTRRVGTGFAQPLYLAGIPDGSGRVLVVQQGGLIRILDPAAGTAAATPFLDVSAQIATDGERGLLAWPWRRFQYYRDLLRLPHRPGRPDSASPLPHAPRRSRSGRSGHGGHDPRRAPPGQQP